MILYNTRTRKTVELEPINPPTVSVYTCGPTVYDYPHIGNWYTFIRYDLLIRTLSVSGYNPRWVMNITDVGHLTSDADDGMDKLEKGAKREGKNAWEVAKFYADYFEQSLKALNFTSPWKLPHATEHINEQIELIQKIETAGYTYKISDGIYYDTSKFSDYGDFAQLDLDEQQSGLRVETNKEKKHDQDFALWKFSPRNSKRDMEWESPWGTGFPGWHIECSAMCLALLGETIDIHSGGIDHIPIHHSNEIAQSEVITGKPLANIWMHTNHILIDDEKIAKSKGNGITLEEIQNKGISLEALRLHILESHYRSQSKFSWDSLVAAQNRLLRYKNFAIKRFQINNSQLNQPLDLLTAMQDDLNSPQALVALESFIAKTDDDTLSSETIIKAIKQIDELFGLKLQETADISDEDKALIVEREQARVSKNWQLADRIREELNTHNIGINDRADKAFWYYLS